MCFPRIIDYNVHTALMKMSVKCHWTHAPFRECWKILLVSRWRYPYLLKFLLIEFEITASHQMLDFFTSYRKRDFLVLLFPNEHIQTLVKQKKQELFNNLKWKNLVLISKSRGLGWIICSKTCSVYLRQAYVVQRVRMLVIIHKTPAAEFGIFAARARADKHY